MKLHYLAVIFVIIMLPIFIVFSEYVGNQITIFNTEATYDARLLNSTYDSIKAFQMNTANTMYYTADKRVENINGAVKTFFNSLVTSFEYEGNKADIMKEYVPAVVFTLYDGYYIYSPYRNVITNIKDEDIDDEYVDNDIVNDLKPYVYYSCRYVKDNIDVVITYSMDNYISVEGKVGEEYWDAKNHSGYLITGDERTKCYKESSRKVKRMPNRN